MDEKIKKLNLLRLSGAMLAYLHADFPTHFGALMFDKERGKIYDFVKFREGVPEFFSTSYLESHSVDDLLRAEAMRGC